MKKLFVFSFVLCVNLFLFCPGRVLAAGLSNGDFESGVLTPWDTTVSSVNAVVQDEEFLSGSYGLELSHYSSSSRGVEQVVTGIVGGAEYTTAAFLKLPALTGVGASSINSASGFVKVAWYSSEDGSGSQLGTVDSVTLTAPVDWNALNFVVTAHPDAHSAKIRLYIKSETNGSFSLGYWDNVSMTPVSAEVPIWDSPTLMATLLGAGGYVIWMKRKDVVHH